MTQYFEHKLQTDEIIIRQDDGRSTFIEENAGLYYPLVKINNTVVPFGDVVSLNFSVGNTFLPTVSITIDDSQYHFREIDFGTQLTYATIFIGCPNDTVYKPIKQTFLINTIDSEPGSSFVSIEAELNVPKLYIDYHGGIQGTSFEVLQEVAKQCDLGFSSNVKSTNDAMFWISSGNRFDMITKDILPGIYKDDFSSFIVFIDHYANLNLIDLKSAFAAGSNIIQETDILKGTKLETSYRLKLSNNTLDRTNEVLITAYTPISYYGELAKNRSDSIETYRLNENVIDENVSVIEGVDQLHDVFKQSSTHNENTHDFYSVASKISNHNRYLLQNTKINVIMDYFVPSIYLYATIPVDIYTTPTRTYRDESSSTDTLADISKNTPVQQSNSHVINERLSGEMIVTEIHYSYTKAISNDSEKFRIQQSLKLFKK